MNRNIVSTFLQSVRNNPEGIALSQDGINITYHQLLEEVISTAKLYQSRGIATGDSVLVFVPMSLPLYRVALALFYIGACPVFLDEWVSMGRLKACLKVVPCKAMIAKPGYIFLSWFIKPLRRIQIKIAANEAGVVDAKALNPVVVGEEGTALVTFTTGSTGVPKAANRTHAYLFAQLEALSPLLNNVGSPCVTLLPIVVLLNLAAGKTTVLPPKKFKASKPGTISHLADALIASQPASIIASPAIVSLLFNHAEGLPTTSLKSVLKGVTSVITGGGPVYPNLAIKMIETFPNANVTVVYGSTEAEPISHIDAAELSKAPLEILLKSGLPVGVPDPAAEVVIIALDIVPDNLVDKHAFETKLMPQNVPGEILVAGAHVLKHYINNPIAEAETKLIIEGKLWHRTGDCGLLDEAGNLYLLGRCNEIIFWNKTRYYPAILAYALQIMAGVTDSAFVLRDGKPIVVLEHNDRSLSAKVKTVLSALQLPDFGIQFIKKIPKDPRHQTKVDYGKLTGALE